MVFPAIGRQSMAIEKVRDGKLARQVLCRSRANPQSNDSAALHLRRCSRTVGCNDSDGHAGQACSQPNDKGKSPCWFCHVKLAKRFASVRKSTSLFLNCRGNGSSWGLWHRSKLQFFVKNRRRAFALQRRPTTRARINRLLTGCIRKAAPARRWVCSRGLLVWPFAGESFARRQEDCGRFSTKLVCDRPVSQSPRVTCKTDFS